MSECHEVMIDYTNWVGERLRRRILPLAISFEANDWHKEPQWLLFARDIEKGENRSFAFSGIHSMVPITIAERCCVDGCCNPLTASKYTGRVAVICDAHWNMLPLGFKRLWWKDIEGRNGVPSESMIAKVNAELNGRK